MILPGDTIVVFQVGDAHVPPFDLNFQPSHLIASHCKENILRNGEVCFTPPFVSQPFYYKEHVALFSSPSSSSSSTRIRSVCQVGQNR